MTANYLKQIQNGAFRLPHFNTLASTVLQERQFNFFFANSDLVINFVQKKLPSMSAVRVLWIVVYIL